MKEMKVRLTFTEEVLGTASNDKEIHAEFIASKAPDALSREEEIAAIGVDEAIAKGKTVFPKDENGHPFLFDYQIKGFFKNAAKAFGYVGGSSKYLHTKQKLIIWCLSGRDASHLLFLMEKKLEIASAHLEHRQHRENGFH